MGNKNSGRKPLPTALKVLRGNPGQRKLNTMEALPERATESFDTPPAEILDDPIALAEWQRLAPMMRVCGLVSMAERTSLLSLCQVWSAYLQAHRKVRELGMIVKNAKGIPMINPYLTVSDVALGRCIRLWVELGLTPSARSKIYALPPAEMANVSKWGTGL